jgi:uncharacterized protein YqgC (DUF456 family)
MHWLWYLILLAVQFLGLSLTLVGLPGIWLMAAALVGFAWLTGWNIYVGWPSVITALALALLAELIEFIAGSVGAKKAGGSRRAMIGAIVGGLIGGFLFTIPLPVIGTIFGACLGCFLGAAIMEMGVKDDAGHALRVGWGAAQGRLWATLLKLGFGLIIALVCAIAAFPV